MWCTCREEIAEREVILIEENVERLSKVEKGKCLVVGEDIAINQILDLSRHTLVRKFTGRRVRMDCLLRWIEENWGLELGYIPIVHLLARGWLGFVFRKEEAVS